MCERCDETVALLEQTKGTRSFDWTVVQFSIPYGKPKLVKMDEQVKTEGDKLGD